MGFTESCCFCFNHQLSGYTDRFFHKDTMFMEKFQFLKFGNDSSHVWVEMRWDECQTPGNVKIKMIRLGGRFWLFVSWKHQHINESQWYNYLCYYHDLWVCKSNLEDYDTDKLEFISGISCFPSKGFQNFHWRNPDVAWCRKEFCAAVNRFKFEKTTWHWKGVKMMYSRTQYSVRCQATKKQRIEWYWKNVLLFLDHFEWVHQNLREQTC